MFNPRGDHWAECDPAISANRARVVTFGSMWYDGIVTIFISVTSN